jgi:hypothetical protein
MDHKFVRHKENKGAIINTDLNALNAYKKRKQIAEEQNNRMTKLENDMSDIKNLLLQLVNKEK